VSGTISQLNCCPALTYSHLRGIYSNDPNMDQRAGKKHQSRVPIPDVNDHLRGPVLLRELEGCAHFNNQSKVAAAIFATRVAVHHAMDIGGKVAVDIEAGDQLGSDILIDELARYFHVQSPP
jgi:hypothetical protein